MFTLAFPLCVTIHVIELNKLVQLIDEMPPKINFSSNRGGSYQIEGIKNEVYCCVLFVDILAK